MKTKDLPAVAEALYQKMQTDGYSKSVIGTARWIIGHFQRYCSNRQIEDVTVPVAVEFTTECFGFDYYNTTIPMQTVVRRPLLILFEFEDSGAYYKTHQRGSTTDIPLIYKERFLEYRNVVNQLDI